MRVVNNESSIEKEAEGIKRSHVYESLNLDKDVSSMMEGKQFKIESTVPN